MLLSMPLAIDKAGEIKQKFEKHQKHQPRRWLLTNNEIKQIKKETDRAGGIRGVEAGADSGGCFLEAARDADLCFPDPVAAHLLNKCVFFILLFSFLLLFSFKRTVLKC